MLGIIFSRPTPWPGQFIILYPGTFMNISTRAIVRSLFVLLLLAGLAAASPQARAQCGTITVVTEKVFPLADNDFLGTVAIAFSSGSYTYAFVDHENGAITGVYDATLGFPVGGTINILGSNIPLNGTGIAPGPPGFPPCLCLEVTSTIDAAGCIIITIRPVCC